MINRAEKKLDDERKTKTVTQRECPECHCFYLGTEHGCEIIKIAQQEPTEATKAAWAEMKELLK
jgi:hypothetical protein